MVDRIVNICFIQKSVDGNQINVQFPVYSESIAKRLAEGKESDYGKTLHARVTITLGATNYTVVQFGHSFKKKILEGNLNEGDMRTLLSTLLKNEDGVYIIKSDEDGKIQRLIPPDPFLSTFFSLKT